jgi:hypothetical protein
VFMLALLALVSNHEFEMFELLSFNSGEKRNSVRKYVKRDFKLQYNYNMFVFISYKKKKTLQIRFIFMRC